MGDRGFLFTLYVRLCALFAYTIFHESFGCMLSRCLAAKPESLFKKQRWEKYPLLSVLTTSVEFPSNSMFTRFAPFLNSLCSVTFLFLSFSGEIPAQQFLWVYESKIKGQTIKDVEPLYAFIYHFWQTMYLFRLLCLHHPFEYPARHRAQWQIQTSR